MICDGLVVESTLKCRVCWLGVLVDEMKWKSSNKISRIAGPRLLSSWILIFSRYFLPFLFNGNDYF